MFKTRLLSGIVLVAAAVGLVTAGGDVLLAGLLLASRDIVGGIAWCKDNKDDQNISKTVEKSKKAFAGGEIKGKKLGVIGLGAIGAEVANAAASLGMEVYFRQCGVDAVQERKAHYQRRYNLCGM